MGKQVKRVTVESITPLIGKYNGNLAAVARALGVSREAVYKVVRTSPTLQATIQEARETMDDMVESVLYNKVLAGSTPELLFYARTRLRHRGYTEHTEVAAAVVGVTVDDWKRNAQKRLQQAEDALTLLGDDDDPGADGDE